MAPESGLVESGAGDGIEIKDVTGIRADTHTGNINLWHLGSHDEGGKERDPALQHEHFRSMMCLLFVVC